MTQNVHPIRRIWEMPDHDRYGPVRRLWLMIEQLFPGGTVQLEARIRLLNPAYGFDQRPVWDVHLARLMDAGLPENAAQRMVLIQLLNAWEWAS